MLDTPTLRYAKDHGFSDAQIGQLRGFGEHDVREIRHILDVRPVYKTVDTCAGEFPALTPYHYSSYDRETEVVPSEARKVVILGSGPNRIGQGVEFDYSCVHASFALHDAGFETIMINCNPETVSTDYDTSDRLYFEPLTLEDVLEVIHAESQSGELVGVVVQLGGQTALGLAKGLKAAGIPILGTTPEAIDLAEERGLFAEILENAGLLAPRNGTAFDYPGAVTVAEEIGYPVLVRPSYVLGGRGMEIVYDSPSLADYFERVADQGIVGPSHPLLVDRFLDDAIEIDVDALYDGTELYIGGVMEHIEEAGIHSGDSSCTLPPVTLGRHEIDRVREATRKIAEGIGVLGLLNVQFAIGAGVLYVLEANPRASRTVPFVSKALGIPLAKAASRIMVGETIADLKLSGLLPEVDGSRIPMDSPVAVKEAVLPFKRFRTKEGNVVDSVLGPEMRSTGEVMGIDKDFPRAFAKSQSAAYGGMPLDGTVFVSVSDRDKRSIVLPVLRLKQLGFEILATEGTAEVLNRNGIAARVVRKFSDAPDGDEPSIVELITRNEVDIVINTPSGRSARADGYEIRAAAVAGDKPLFTTIAELSAAVASIDAIREGFEVRSLQEYALDRAARL
jgi:carbamoyl-phosphate synthase large subunit